jgi:hypothetical protein
VLVVLCLNEVVVGVGIMLFDVTTGAFSSPTSPT